MPATENWSVAAAWVVVALGRDRVYYIGVSWAPLVFRWIGRPMKADSFFFFFLIIKKKKKKAISFAVWQGMKGQLYTIFFALLTSLLNY